MKNKKNYYTILELSYQNSPDEITQKQIKEAFKKLSLQNHPDRAKDKEKAHLKTVEINEAYSILADIDKRKKYDEKLTAQEEEELSLLCMVELPLVYAHSTIQEVPYLLFNCIQKLSQFGFRLLTLPETNITRELQTALEKTQNDSLKLLTEMKSIIQQLFILIKLIDVLVEKKDKEIKKTKGNKNFNEFKPSYQKVLDFMKEDFLKLEIYSKKNNYARKNENKKQIGQIEFISYNEMSEIKEDIDTCVEESSINSESSQNQDHPPQPTNQDGVNSILKKDPLNDIYEKIRKAYIYISRSKINLLELKESESYSIISPILSDIFNHFSSFLEIFSNIKSNLEKIEKFLQENNSSSSEYYDSFFQILLLMINNFQTMHTSESTFPSRPGFFSFPSSQNAGRSSNETQILKF